MKYLLLVFWLFFVQISFAQSGSFAALDSYLPLAGSELNPAVAAETKSKWVVSPCKTDLQFFNNFFYLSMPFSPYRFIGKNMPKEYTTKDGNPIWDWTWVKMDERTNAIRLHTFVRNSGPAVLLKKGNYVWTFRSDVSAMVCADGLPGKIVRDQVNDWNRDNGSPPIQKMAGTGLENRNQTMTIMQQAYTALNFGLARQFKLLRSKDLSIGVNYRVLHSLGGYYLQVKTGDVFYDDKGNVRVKSPSVYFAELLPRRNWLWAHGMGSADVGILYTYRNVETRRPGGYNQSHPDYKFKMGFSILDIGNLIYTRTMVTNVSMSTNVKLPNPEEFENKTPEQILDQYKGSFQKEISIQNNIVYGDKVKVGLPLRAVYTTDFQLSRHLFWGFIYMQNMRKRNSNNLTIPTFINSGFRMEYKYVGVALPVKYTPFGNQLNVGGSFRLGPLFFGTSNLGTFLKPKGIYAADIYFGVHITNLPGTMFKKKLPYMFTRKRSCAEF